MSRKRTYYVHEVDAEGFATKLAHETWTNYGSSDALDWAEYHARTDGKTYLVTNERGRALARFHANGEMDYLGW